MKKNNVLFQDNVVDVCCTRKNFYSIYFSTLFCLVLQNKKVFIKTASQSVHWDWPESTSQRSSGSLMHLSRTDDDDVYVFFVHICAPYLVVESAPRRVSFLCWIVSSSPAMYRLPYASSCYVRPHIITPALESHIKVFRFLCFSSSYDMLNISLVLPLPLHNVIYYAASSQASTILCVFNFKLNKLRLLACLLAARLLIRGWFS